MSPSSMMTVPLVPVISSCWAKPGYAAVLATIAPSAPEVKAEQGESGVLGLHPVAAGGGHRRHLGDRAHAPAQQVDVVDALVEERLAVDGASLTSHWYYSSVLLPLSREGLCIVHDHFSDFA
jgi:hypothetical protein